MTITAQATPSLPPTPTCSLGLSAARKAPLTPASSGALRHPIRSNRATAGGSRSARRRFYRTVEETSKLQPASLAQYERRPIPGSCSRHPYPAMPDPIFRGRVLAKGRMVEHWEATLRDAVLPGSDAGDRAHATVRMGRHHGSQASGRD